MTAPSPWSSVNPKLQRAWDATSLKALMTCARYYQYSIIEGWRFPGNVDTDFGGFFASATETYKKVRLAGKSKQDATLAALRYTIEATYTDAGPWGGRYEERWRCTGTTPYRNARGNKAKCPWSHKGVWLPSPAPGICGTCGSQTETQRQWVSDNPTKDRYTLVRLVTWYCDEQPENPEDGAFPYQFPNGQPAVELSFSFPLPFKETIRKGEGEWPAIEGEPYLLAGHMDSIMVFGGENFISDNKTTKNALNQNYFAQYAPNVQVDTYDLAGSVLFPDLNIKGVMIEGAQVLREGARFGVGVVYKNELQRNEFLEELGWWLKQAERYAEDDYWPMNRSACYLCPFKQICSKEEPKRQMFLEANFVKRHWNPLEER